MRKTRLLKGILLALACTVSMAVMAQTETAKHVNVPAGDLATGIETLRQQTGGEILFRADQLRGVRTRGVQGNLAPAEALDRLLDGTGFSTERDSSGAVFIVPSPVQPRRSAERNSQAVPETVAGDEEVVSLSSITVTGTRIRGGTTPSPVTIISAENIQEEGFVDLGEVIRSIPQNFSGGQNPGVLSGTGNIANQNITGGAGLNLRGLGPDASLTLLNGRRLSYGGFVQGVDISAIPVEAVERIEIVADGASAIYGSDAVGGVGNVILRRDFDGVQLGVRHGSAADGGLSTREYVATAGTTWSSGGLIAAWRKTSGDPIYSDQRDYTQDVYDPRTLYQGSDLRSALLSAHQSWGDFVALRLDAFRTEREAYTSQAEPTIYYENTREAKTSLISPGIELSLPNDWTLTLGGTLGKDETVSSQPIVTRATGEVISIPRASYHNESRTYEVGAEGPLFTLPGGDARLAVGAGYRNNDFLQRNLTSVNPGSDGDESSRFAYAELNLPLIGADQSIAGVRRLALTGAVRGEDYDSFGGVTTPKLGLIYGPSTDFTLKASWGKSFKAPTLLQQYQPRFAYLYPTTMFGSTDYAIDATALYLIGGNPDLNPERSRTSSVSLAFHPEALPGLEAELTWFDIDYTDRVVQPINPFQALINPIYAEFIDFHPTAAEQADAIAPYIHSNFSVATYDASKVVAVVPNQYINTSRQRVKGLDLSGSYRFDIGAGRLMVRGSAGWLDSTQQITSAQSAYDLAGTLFHPAKISSRIGVVWNQGGFTASAFGNYVGGVTDTTTDEKGSSFTTFDTTLRYDTGGRNDGLSGFAFELSAQNMFNRAPPLYAAASLANVPYDSTNYSAIGRFLSLSVSKRW